MTASGRNQVIPEISPTPIISSVLARYIGLRVTANGPDVTRWSGVAFGLSVVLARVIVLIAVKSRAATRKQRQPAGRKQDVRQRRGEPGKGIGVVQDDADRDCRDIDQRRQWQHARLFRNIAHWIPPSRIALSVSTVQMFATASTWERRSALWSFANTPSIALSRSSVSSMQTQ